MFAEGAGSGGNIPASRGSFLERASSPTEDVFRDVLDGTEELAAFNVVNTVSLKVCSTSLWLILCSSVQWVHKLKCSILQGDAKDKVLAYAEEHSPDLLIIGRSLGSRLKKVIWTA